MRRISLAILVAVIGLTSCGYQSSFQKQKYLKGSLRQSFGESPSADIRSNDSETTFTGEAKIPPSNVSVDPIELDELESLDDNIETPNKSNLSGEEIEKVIDDTERQSVFLKNHKRSFRSGPNDGEGPLIFFVLFFLVLSVLALFLLIWIGPWAFLVSFGCIVLAFLFYLWFNEIASSGGELLGAIGAILLFPLALIILLLTMLIRWIVLLF